MERGNCVEYKKPVKNSLAFLFGFSSTYSLISFTVLVPWSEIIFNT